MNQKLLGEVLKTIISQMECQHSNIRIWASSMVKEVDEIFAEPSGENETKLPDGWVATCLCNKEPEQSKQTEQTGFIEQAIKEYGEAFWHEDSCKTAMKEIGMPCSCLMNSQKRFIRSKLLQQKKEIINETINQFDILLAKYSDDRRVPPAEVRLLLSKL